MKEISVFEKETFDKVDRSERVVSGKTFTSCTFTNCIFTKTVFEDCTFESCTFDKCDLTMIKVKSSSFRQIKITNSKAIGILWYDAKSPFTKHPLTIICTDSNISYSSFYGVNLKKAKFNRCMAKEVDFSECNLTEAEMERSDLEGSRFVNCDMTCASLKGAQNYFIDIQSNKVKGAKFSLPEAISLLNSLDIVID